MKNKDVRCIEDLSSGMEALAEAMNNHAKLLKILYLHLDDLKIQNGEVENG